MNNAYKDKKMDIPLAAPSHTSDPSPVPLTLEEAFHSTFHNKFRFDDFLNLDVSTEYTKLQDKDIYKPSDKLKKYLRFLNSFVFDDALINENVVHSYKKGKSPYTAITSHANNTYFFKTDLINFFHSVEKSDVENIFDENLSTVKIIDLKKYKQQILNLVCIENVLPIGFPTSPNITNTFLLNFDNDLEHYCNLNEIIYTRYSDDIIMSSKEKGNLKGIEEIVEGKIRENFSDKIQLNHKKTKHTHKGNKVTLLGINLLPSGKITADIKDKKEIESTFYYFINDKEKFESCIENFFGGKKTSLSAKLNYIKSIDKNFSDKLRKKYGNFVVDYFSNNPE